MTDRVLSRRTAERLTEAATAAPSMHNSQPWRFVVWPAERVIDLYADPARTLRHGDPHGRAVHIACGAALFNLRLAIMHEGIEPVARLLPQPRNPMLLATVRLAGPYRPRPAERDLYAAITPRPGRQPLVPQPVSRRLMAGLAEEASLEGASLRPLEHADVLRLLRLTAAADHQLCSDPGYLAELASWTGGMRRPSAVPAAQWQPTRAAGGGMVPAPALPADPVARLPHPALAAAPQLVALCTAADDRVSWLRAGQAMQRVLLFATHHGVRAAPLTPVLEVADAPLRGDQAFGGEYPEMILRFGYGPPGVPAPRRPLWQTLRIIAPASGDGDKSPQGTPPPALVGR